MNFVFGQMLVTLLTILQYLIFAHIILSWIREINPTLWRLGEAVDTLVNPILQPFRNIIPALDLGGLRFDLTPIIVYFLLGIAKAFIISIFM